MEARLRELTSTSVLCVLFFLFFPLSKWFLLAAFITLDFSLYIINQKRHMHMLGTFIVILIFSSFLFYPDFAAIMCMCLCSFTFHAINIDPGKKFIITTIVVGIHIVNSPSLGLLIVLIAVFLFHLIITIMITSRNKIQLSQRLKVMIALGVGGIITIGLIPYFASGVRNLLSIGIYGLASLVSGGFYKVFNIEGADKEKQERIDSLTSLNSEWETYYDTEYRTNPYLYSLLIILLLVIFIVVILFIVKRRKAMQLEFKDKRMSVSMKSSPLLNKDQKKGRRVSSSPPSNIPIRMLVYKLEKEMKEDYRRRHGEPFHDWLNRIHLDGDELNDRLAEIYEKTRYGEEDRPKNDLKFFKDGLKLIKKQLKNSGST